MTRARRMRTCGIEHAPWAHHMKQRSPRRDHPGHRLSTSSTPRRGGSHCCSSRGADHRASRRRWINRVCRACSRCSCPFPLTTHRPVPYSCTRSPPLGSQHVAPRGPNSRGASVHQRVFLAGFFTPAQLAAVICGPSAAKIVLRLRLRPLQHRSCVVRREHFRTAPNTPNSAKTREFISFSFFLHEPYGQ